MTSKPHDALFRAAFENPEHAAGELRAVLPEAVARVIDWSTLRLESGTFVDGALRERLSDLLFSVQVGKYWAFIYLLFEHQSTDDRSMPLRTLAYKVRIWERDRVAAGDKPLGIIIPVVLSHRSGGWTGPRRFSELLDPRVLEIEGLSRFVPDFELVIDDLSTVSNERLKARALAPFPSLALWLLRDARSAKRLLRNLAEWGAALDAVAEEPDGAQALGKLFRYLTLVVPDVPYREFRARISELAPKAEDTLMTIAEELHQQGRAKGREEGREEGRQEGREEGRQEAAQSLLRKLLTLKFGALAEPHEQRLQGATELELERYAERVLLAGSVDDVFAG